MLKFTHVYVLSNRTLPFLSEVFSSSQLAFFSYPDWGSSMLFPRVVRQMPGYKSQRRGTAHALPKLTGLFYVLFVCKCVLYYCHQVSTQLQVTNISYQVERNVQEIKVGQVTQYHNCLGFPKPSLWALPTCKQQMWDHSHKCVVFQHTVIQTAITHLHGTERETVTLFFCCTTTHTVILLPI